jgi:site-specific recombinase XerC
LVGLILKTMAKQNGKPAAEVKEEQALRFVLAAPHATCRFSRFPHIRRKLSALSSLFDYLYERNAVAGNPVDGASGPMANNNEGSAPALGDAQARRLLKSPAPDTLKGVRDLPAREH